MSTGDADVQVGFPVVAPERRAAVWAMAAGLLPPPSPSRTDPRLGAGGTPHAPGTHRAAGEARLLPNPPPPPIFLSGRGWGRDLQAGGKVGESCLSPGTPGPPAALTPSRPYPRKVPAAGRRRKARGWRCPWWKGLGRRTGAAGSPAPRRGRPQAGQREGGRRQKMAAPQCRTRRMAASAMAARR